jgi:hypothetical protein
MEKTLRLLDSFNARGNDDKTHSVHVYEHLAKVDLLTAGQEQWEPTGKVEYKLADGRPLDVDAEGVMRVAGGDLVLKREK